MNKKFKDMSIKQKLNFGYAIVIVFMILSGIVSLTGLTALNRGLNDFVNGSNKADTAVKLSRIHINIAARNIREALLNSDESSFAGYRQSVEENLALVDEELKSLKATEMIEDELYQKYVNAITEWGNAGNEILNMIASGDRSKAAEAILEVCAPALENLDIISEEMDAVTDEMMDQSVNRSATIFMLSLLLIIGFIVVAVIVAMLIGNRIVKSITEPLLEIEAVAKDLSEGNLHTQIEYSSNDEIGKLAHSLRESIRILSSYVDDIGRAMGEFANGNFDVQPKVEWRGDFIGILDAFMMFERSMAETIRSIQRVANQVENGSIQVSDSSTELAHGATEQASITEELAATIETISEQVALNAEHAKEISRRMENAGVEIVNGNERMKEMVSSMGEISESSQKIRKIIDTINDIASQTNLLALNASIEAARAGDAGKGFAVVAAQVSVLASQSAEAAKESTLLIESSLKAVEKGIVIADKTAKQLESVVADSKIITEEVNRVADALESQTESFAQINDGVDHINDVVQTNSATSEECAAASQEMSSQASMLEGLISKFQVGSFD